MGVAWPPTLLPTPVVSYTTFSPLRLTNVSLAVCFCGPIQEIASLRMLSGIVLYGVRTFLNRLQIDELRFLIGLASQRQSSLGNPKSKINCDHPASLGFPCYHELMHVRALTNATITFSFELIQLAQGGRQIDLTHVKYAFVKIKDFIQVSEV